MTANGNSEGASADGHRGRAPKPSAAALAGRRPYEPPRLARYGRLVDVTLGGSPGAGDSGGGVLIENPLTGGP